LHDTPDINLATQSNMAETEFVNRVVNLFARSRYHREDAILAAPTCTFWITNIISRLFLHITTATGNGCRVKKNIRGTRYPKIIQSLLNYVHTIFVKQILRILTTHW